MSNVTKLPLFTSNFEKSSDSTPKKKWGGGGVGRPNLKKKDFLKIHPIYVENVVYFDDILI